MISDTNGTYGLHSVPARALYACCVVGSGARWPRLCQHSPVSLAVRVDSGPASSRVAAEALCPTLPELCLCYTQARLPDGKPKRVLFLLSLQENSLGDATWSVTPCSPPDRGQPANPPLTCRLLFFASVVTIPPHPLLSLVCLVFLSIQV